MNKDSIIGPYQNDVAILKKFNNGMYKLVLCKSLRRKGFEVGLKSAKGSVNDSKLDNNISRAKSKIKEYALCNEFEYFVTLTIDKNKYDRMDLSAYYKDFGQFIRNYNRNHNTKVEYVFIPEHHQDGAWHMHGLVKGIPEKHLTINEHGYLDWFHYRDRFGWISLDPIRSQEKVSNYITKYINKDMTSTIKALNAKTYYCSKGLKTALELKRGTLCDDSIPYDFENDYVKIKWFKSDNIANSIK